MSSHYISSHYGSSHKLSHHYGRIPFEEEQVHPPGMRRRRIEDEDEVIMAIIMAFLEMKG